MQPRAQVEKRTGWNAEDGETVDVRRVALAPSYKGGHFVIEDPYYGTQVVDKVVLLNVADKDLESMHATGEFPLDEYVATDERGNSSLTAGRAQVTIQFNRGSENSMSLEVDSFREFAAVIPEAPASV